MKSLALAALVALAFPAHAQLYKCVDERGKTHYSDKPIPGCKTAKTIEPPAAPPTQAKAKPKPKALAKARTEPEMSPEQFASRCKTLREEREWLLSPRGAGIPSHAERLGQINHALRACR